jgi:hypothetical protein
VGSIHSGHRKGKPLAEDCLSLDLAWLMRLGPIRTGQGGNGEINWSVDGHTIAALRFRLDLRAIGTARLILFYSVVTPEGQRKPIRQMIALTARPQHFGGLRWWMRCPVTGERVRVLYLPPECAHFASREALGLAYRVERLSRFDRPFEKLFRTQRRLGGRQGLGAGSERPKGMWQQTFARHVADLAKHDRACVERITTAIESA